MQTEAVQVLDVAALMKFEHSRIPLLVVILLGLDALVLSVGLLALAYYDKKTDAALFTLAGSAIGALAAILTSTNARSSQRASDERTSQAPVPVVNAPGEPLKTEEVRPDTKGTQEDTAKDNNV